MSQRGVFIPPIPQRPVVAQGAYDASRDRLRRIAKYQRWVLLALLFNVIMAVIVMTNLLQLATIPPMVLRVLSVARIPICLFMTVAIVLLARQFWNMFIVIICGLLMWVPLPGVPLIMLLVVNSKATKFLQQYGIHVGLLGAHYNRI